LAKEWFLEGSNYSLPGVGWEYFGELQFEIENDSETFSQEIDYITRPAAIYKSFILFLESRYCVSKQEIIVRFTTPRIDQVIIAFLD
jgi:hypothetical protein